MILAKYLNESIPPIQMAFWRWTFAAITAMLVVLPVLGVMRERLWQERKRIFMLGALGMAFCGPAVYQAAKTTTAMNIGLVYAASPVFMGIFSLLLGLGKPHPLGWTGIGVALVGVFIVLSEGDPSMVQSQWSLDPGLLWVLASTIAWAIYSVLLRQRAKNISEDAYLFAICLCGVLILAPLLLLEGQGFVAKTVGMEEWFFLIFLGVVPSFLAYRGYAVVQKELGILAAGSILFLTPLTNSFLAEMLLNEGIQAFHIIGGAAILLGTALVIKYPARGG